MFKSNKYPERFVGGQIWENSFRIFFFEPTIENRGIRYF